MQANKATQLPPLQQQVIDLRQQNCPPQAIAHKVGISTREVVRIVDKSNKQKEEVEDRKCRWLRTARIINYIENECINIRALSKVTGISYSRLRYVIEKSKVFKHHEISALTEHFNRMVREWGFPDALPNGWPHL